MRILIAGADYQWSIERHYIKHLRELGIECKLFGIQNIKFDYLDQSIINKLAFKLNLSKIHHKISLALESMVKHYQPDVLWVFKGMEILPETLNQFKKQGLFLVNYNPDHPFIFSGSGSGNANVTNSIPFYHLHFSYNIEVVEKIKKEYAIPCYQLPFGYEKPENIDDIISDDNEIIAPCFIGNPDKERAKTIRKLNHLGVKFDIYGHHWNKYISNKHNNIHDAVYGDDYWKTLRKYRVQINILRLHNLGSHNMRTFEIPAIGGIQLTLDTSDHRLFFNDNEEIFLYNNLAEAKEKISHLINLNLSQTKSIRNACYLKTIKDDHSYQNLTKISLKTIIEEHAKTIA